MEENIISTKDFLKMFCGISLITEHNSFNKDTLYNFIKKYKKNEKYSSLLSNFNNNLKKGYNDSLKDLEFEKIIKFNELYLSVITINPNISVLYLIKDNIECFDLMVKLFSEYRRFSMRIHEKAVDKFIYDYEPENIIIDSLSKMKDKVKELKR